MSFAEQLSYLMESSGTKDGELAQYIGVSRQAIMGWKSGAMPALRWISVSIRPGSKSADTGFPPKKESPSFEGLLLSDLHDTDSW